MRVHGRMKHHLPKFGLLQLLLPFLNHASLDAQQARGGGHGQKEEGDVN